MDGKSGRDAAPIKMENETGVSDMSDDSRKRFERGNDIEMAMIKSEINDDLDDNLDHIRLKDQIQLQLSREALKLKEPICQELSIGSNSLLHQSKDVLNLPSSTPMEIKTEPLDHSYVHSLGNTSTTSQEVSSGITDGKYRLDGEQIKGEMETSVEPCEDEIDNMLLQDRMKLLALKMSSDVEDHSRNYDLSQKFVPAAAETPIASDATHPLKNERPRKKKKTVIVSVETALQEDAPGLVQMLHEKGILMSEIKLYGATESNELIDDDSSEGGNLSEFEAVISKLLPPKFSLMKLAALRSSAKSEKKIYCLDCLVALVEQSRFLVSRKMPAEWGWCRDLRSFIFVFREHNRIVLERPEYGFATYFFQLLRQLPVKWQIDRLVIVMKFGNNSRTSILENKPLKIGVDLNEVEANVLEGYGWVESCGLATMLNYEDRVFHSASKENSRSEWKAKIVKILTDGMNRGYIFLDESQIPKKGREYLETFGFDDEETSKKAIWEEEYENLDEDWKETINAYTSTI